MFLKTSTRLFTILLFLVFLIYQGKAQRLQDMTFSQSNGTWQEMTGGTYLTTGDDVSAGFYVPFNFKWDGRSYTANVDIFYACTNGYMWFGSDRNFTYNYWSRYLNDLYPSITPIRGDLYCRGQITAGVIGSAPNRVLIVQWTGMDYYYQYNANNNFQVRLYETSNKAEIIYGPMYQGSYSISRNLWCGFVGIEPDRSYINVVPGETFQAYYSSKNPAPYYNNGVITNANIGYLTSGKTISLTSFPNVVGVYPTRGSIFARGQIYTGNQHPGMYFDRISGQADVWARYRISGPLPGSNPDYQTIYIGTQSDPTKELFTFSPQPVGSPAFAKIANAKGIAARASDGALDLQTNQFSIPGGEYVVEAQMELPQFNYVQYVEPDDPPVFIIALQNDLAITQVVSPRTKNVIKYPLSSFVPVQVRYTNVGINPVTSFETTIQISLDGVVKYEETATWPNNPPQSLTTGQSVILNFANFRPRDVGIYDFLVTTTLLNANDDDLKNNRVPRSGSDFQLEVSYEIEAEALSISVPGDQVFIGRPVLPIARFKNNGVSDISDLPAWMYIIRLATGDTVYRDNIIIQDIPAGTRVNTTQVIFNSNFIPEFEGAYQACITCYTPDDPKTSNNTYCKTFEVVGALSGTYTIGTTNYGNARNFNTFDLAIDALFTQGISGPVVFELTDAVYNVGDINNPIPAIDLSSKIIGVNSNRTITFKPSSSRAIYKGSITINLHSAAGIGILIGQNQAPTNPNAAVNFVTSNLVKRYAQSEGNIIFDGGNQKSIKLRLNTNSPFRAVFDLRQGAANNTIKNCIIENYAGNVHCNVTLPLTRYNTSLQGFEYQPDANGNISYSAGILMRSTAPFDKGSTVLNSFNLDSSSHKNNKILNNEISGFGYGVVSIGTGMLFDPNTQTYKNYYANNNLISGNTIFDVCRAGIFVGFEDNTIIENNRIYRVTGSSNTDAAGIIAGGEGNANYPGYNNTRLTISGNEISNVNSSVFALGIKVEQIQLTYPSSPMTDGVFPSIAENTKVINNVIWGLYTTNTSANRAGIHLLTARTTANTDWLTKMITPRYQNYTTKNDMIINNTIRILSNNGLNSNGAIAGIGVQNSVGTKIFNNAIALEDRDVSKTNPVYAAIFYQGQFPSSQTLTSDRNAFWYVNNSGGTIYRFILTDNMNNNIDAGLRDEYASLSQWQAWTGQDMNSIFGDFTNDLTLVGTEPNQKLRIKSNPVPLGSILSNRGDRFTWITSDIDGNPRGPSGIRFDIGASEFSGNQYLTDVEAIMISEPMAYKTTTGKFSEAEYIMTAAPVEIKARFRNNGNLQLSGIQAYLRIYRELPNGQFSTTTEIPLQTVEIPTIPSSETVEVSFNLADGNGLDFYPSSYGDFRGTVPAYVVPEEFRTMEANVTPKYKIEVSVMADQNNNNNIITKIVRFYIQRSPFRILLSSENSNVTLAANSPADVVAGKLNYDSLVSGINKLGWFIEMDSDPRRYDYDVFERKGWEARAVDYSIYRTLIWSDGDDKPATRIERSDILRFLNEGDRIHKKNLMIGSQEMVRQHSQNDANNDQYFINNVLKAVNVAPGNPLGSNVSNDGNEAIGYALFKGLRQKIIATKYTGDKPPYCGIMSVSPEGQGLSLPAYFYENHSATPNDSAVGVATASLNYNIAHIGVDWRHWSNIALALRSIIDWLEKNGGIIPVELVNFEANPAGNRVIINWATASEYNTDKFELQRAVKNESGISPFSNIATEKAAGQSQNLRNYGPIIDRDVKFGNTYVYRLKMIDLDGLFEYSNEVEVRLDESGSIWLSEAKPNPANSEARFTFSLNEPSFIDISLYDLSGKVIMNLFNGFANQGSTEVKIDLGKVPSGVYNYILNVNGRQFFRQIQVVK